jgi:predicted dehydrogenase
MTRVAVVGVGAMGKNHVRVYQEMPDAELVAVVDRDSALAEEIGRIYRVPVYADIHEMVEREKPEAVSVAVPTRVHFPVAKALLEAGCHVLVEKPIADTVEEGRQLVKAAERVERVLAVGHIERFNPAVTELKRRLETGELGRVFQVHARRLGPFPTRIQDVGVVMDLATHDLDIMQYLIGNPVSRVFAETKRELHAHCEDLFVGVLRFADTTVGLLEINWLTPTKIRTLYVTGERGMFRVNYITQELCFFENADAAIGSDWSALNLLQGVSQGTIVQYPIKKQEPLRAELESFIGRVQGKESRIVDGRQAIATLALAKMLGDSALNGGVREVIHDQIIRPAANGAIQKDRKVNSSTISPLQASV